MWGQGAEDPSGTELGGAGFCSHTFGATAKGKGPDRRRGVTDRYWNRYRWADVPAPGFDSILEITILPFDRI